MADFCSLCGYIDIDIIEIYETRIRPKIQEHLKNGTGWEVSGICESCGIIMVFPYEIDGKLFLCGEFWRGSKGNEFKKIGTICNKFYGLTLYKKKEHEQFELR